MNINWNNNLTWTLRLTNNEMQDLFILLETRKIYPSNQILKAVRQQLKDKSVSIRKWVMHT